MISHPQDEKELRKSIYKLRTNLREDIKEVREALNASSLIPTDAIQHMRKLEKEMREKSVRKMDMKELTSLYRKLSYTRNLKSSYLEGAELIAERWTPIKRNLDSLSQEQRDKWWSIYEKLYKYYSGLQHYKYEIFNVIDYNFSGADADDIVGNIINIYDEVREGDGGKRTDEEIMLLFSERLQSLLR